MSTVLPAAARPPAIARRPGRGLLLALMLLLAVEAWLHSDAFLYRFRSVFAAGRAMDKVLHVQAQRPGLLILGNSRADNAFDPRTLTAALGFDVPRGAFNLGLPGADARVIHGIVQRLDRAGAIGPAGARQVLLVLDEALVQPVDTLGQDVFFASATQAWADGRPGDALRASLRLYGYTDNLRQLREPGTLARFVAALQGPVEPVGGAAAEHLGYRKGFGRLQDAGAAMAQEAGSRAPPDPVNVLHLWRMLDLLHERGVQVAVVWPPLLNRDVLYVDASAPAAAPYRSIAAEIQRRGLPVLALDAGPPRAAAEFMNAGHLNDRGAQRYTRLLAQALNRAWAGGAAPATVP